MNFFLSFFLKIRAWQLFILMTAVMVGQGLVMTTVANPFDGIALAFAIGTPAIMLLIDGWLLTIAITANNKLPSPLQQSPVWTITATTYGFIYILYFVLSVIPESLKFAETMAQLHIEGRLQEMDPSTITGPPIYIFPLHILAMFCMFYLLIYTAKRFVTLEQNREVKSSDYIEVFFMLWIFPIGVWLIQPRVNRLFANKPAQ